MKKGKIKHVYQDLERGQIVKSKAGRDKGKIYLIWEIFDGGFVAVINGSSRKIDKPKKKKIRHLQIFCSKIDDFDEIVNHKDFNDALVRRLLEPYQEIS